MEVMLQYIAGVSERKRTMIRRIVQVVKFISCHVLYKYAMIKVLRTPHILKIHRVNHVKDEGGIYLISMIPRRSSKKGKGMK